jgi:hypothetical protein
MSVRKFQILEYYMVIIASHINTEWEKLTMNQATVSRLIRPTMMQRTVSGLGRPTMKQEIYQ